MKQYMVSVWHVEGEEDPSAEETQRIYKDVDGLNNELLAADVMVFGGGLHPPETATVVRADKGDVLTTDGPFAEAKEQIGGFWVIKAEDLDAVLKWAGKAAAAVGGPVEVRPFQEEID